MPFLKNHVAQGQGTEKLQSCGNNLHFESEYQLTNGDFLETRGKNTRSLSDEILSGAEVTNFFLEKEKRVGSFLRLSLWLPFLPKMQMRRKLFQSFPLELSLLDNFQNLVISLEIQVNIKLPLKKRENDGSEQNKRFIPISEKNARFEIKLLHFSSMILRIYCFRLLV